MLYTCSMLLRVDIGRHLRELVQGGIKGPFLSAGANVRSQPQVDHNGRAVRRGEQVDDGVERRPYGDDRPKSCPGWKIRATHN